jgi:large subunit ribosomal protein L23
MNVHGKLRRRGQKLGYTADWKKAIVTLAEGNRIELFEGV